MKILINLFILIFIFNFSYSQTNEINKAKQDNLLTNANSLVINHSKKINILSENSMQINSIRKVLILNEVGLANLDDYLYYDNKTKLKKLQLRLFNINEIKPYKTIKEKDFKDENVSDGFSIVTDSRVKRSNYQHIGDYPFIAEFEYEYTTSNTAHIPAFHPMENQFESVLNYDFEINYNILLGFQKLEKNLTNFLNNKEIKIIETEGNISYTAQNLKYTEYENLSLGYSKLRPFVLFALQKFNLEGVKGEAKNWEEFGKWYYGNFINGQQDLSSETVQNVINLTSKLTNPIEKAKVLYEYMQSKTRYISIQLGIGGWKPFPASYVDKKGFGDCKALSNYMLALLKVADVNAYVTIVNAGSDIQDINDDIVSLQGNHMILAIPNENNYIFLECTSQNSPFGFQGDFTDSRKVLIIKPEGAEIVKTHTSLNENNSHKTKATIIINENGSLKSSFEIQNSGIFYDACSNYQSLEKESVVKMITNRYDIFKNIEQIKFNYKNDKNKILFIEDYQIDTKPFLKKMGNQFIVPINFFHQINFLPTNYDTKLFDFYTGRGFEYIDEIIIKLPEKAKISFIPESTKIDSEFGTYNLIISMKGNEVFYKRNFLLKSNVYDKQKYHLYQKFRNEISQLESLKLIFKL